MADHIACTIAVPEPRLARPNRRAAKLFLKIVGAYHIRQCIFPHLTATEAAKLIRATNIDSLIGQQEQLNVLNPMRNLFTDDELVEIRSQLASDPNHHVLVVGRDLEDLYARVANADKLDSGIPLLLSIVEATIRSITYGNTSATTGPDGSEPKREWHVVSTTDLPGEWSTDHTDRRASSIFRQSCEVSEEKQDIRDRRIRLRRRKLEEIDDRFVSHERRIVFDHLTHKGIMNLLKGNVKQSLGKANRELHVLGLDSYGSLVPVLDDLVFVDMRNHVLQKAINSGRTRYDCVSSTDIPQAHIEVKLMTYVQNGWYIPLGSEDKKDTNG